MFTIDGTHISIIRGDSADFDIEIQDQSGNPYELSSDDIIEFTVKDNVHSNKSLIHKFGPQIIIEPEDTSKLGFRDYIYDVQVTLADDTVDTIIPPSIFSVLSEVTT